MPDFSALLRKPIAEAKRPPALDAGNYPGVVKSFEYGDNNKNKTPYVRYMLAATGWAEGVEPQPGVDLSKRTFRRDFYLGDDAIWRLAEFLKSCGVEEGKGFEEGVPEVIGHAVMMEVQQYLNQTSGEIGNQIGNLVGEG